MCFPLLSCLRGRNRERAKGKGGEEKIEDKHEGA